jgi:hypothetical protein
MHADQVVTIVVAVIGAGGAAGGMVWVDRRVQRAREIEGDEQAAKASVDYERTSAARAQAMDGETLERLRSEIIRLDKRLDDYAKDAETVGRRLVRAEERVATAETRVAIAENRVAVAETRVVLLADTLRHNEIAVPPLAPALPPQGMNPEIPK